MFRWYYLASGFFILQMVGFFPFIDRHFYGEHEGGDPLSSALNLLQILVDVSLFCRGIRNLRTIPTGATLAIALALFLCLSSLWSIDPTVTARRGSEYLFFVLGTIGIATSLEGDEFMDLLTMACFLSAICSVLLLLVYPDNAMMPEHDALRGVSFHKNTLGQAMATGALASLYGIRAGGSRRLRSIVALIACVAVAIPAKSSTALLTIGVFCAAEGILVLLRGGVVLRVLAALLIAVLLPAVAVIAMDPDAFIEALGKDPDLSGRTELWSYVDYYISQRPVLGWGLYAFWGSANPAVTEIWAVLGWEPPHAHNGLREMLLEVGIVGTLFFASVWLRTVVVAVLALRTPARELGITALLCCGGIVLVGVSEVALVDPSQSSVAVFFVTGLMCERAVRRTRRGEFAVPSRGRLAAAGNVDWTRVPSAPASGRGPAGSA